MSNLDGVHLQFPSGEVSVPPGLDPFIIARQVLGLLEAGEEWVSLYGGAGVTTWSVLERDEGGAATLLGYTAFDGTAGVVLPDYYAD